MSDVTAAAPAPAAAPSGGFQFPSLGSIGTMLKRGDIALAIGVLTILVVLILPLPPILLDLALAICAVAMFGFHVVSIAAISWIVLGLATPHMERDVYA